MKHAKIYQRKNGVSYSHTRPSGLPQDDNQCDTASIYIMFFIHVLWTMNFLQKVKNILQPVQRGQLSSKDFHIVFMFIFCR